MSGAGSVPGAPARPDEIAASSPGTWEGLFDELADANDGARESRLAEIEEARPDLAALLRRLLAADREESGFLEKPLAERAPSLLSALLADEERPEPKDRAGELVGRYRLLSLLGRGGMGEVWLAERADGEFEGRAAVKLARPELGSPVVLERFLRERKILAQLAHPGIARLLDAGRTAAGEPYFVLEHVDGVPITDWCARPSTALADTLRLFAEVCDAVDHAHRGLVVHRDIKPSNVLVDAAGRPKLLDFGIARVVEAARGAEGDEPEMLWGASALTPAYAAPEQLLGRPVTTAADVYSLGVLLYQLLTGFHPHPRAERRLDALSSDGPADTAEAPSARLLRAVDEGAAPPEAKRRAARLAGDLDAVVQKAMAREPSARYPTAAALARDLERSLANRPVEARAGGTGYRAVKFVRRNRLAVAAAVVALAALVGGLAVSLERTRVARAEARRAERVRTLLVSVFEGADPESASGGERTARSLLTQGTRRVERELADEPALRAEMLELLAGIHRKLGLLPEGRALAERAFAARRSLHGDASAEAAGSLVTLAWTRVDQGEATEARPLLEQAIRTLEAALGKESLAVADAREPLVEAIYATSNPEAALPVLEARLATYRSVLGLRHEKTALATSDRGVLLLTVGRSQEAEADLRAALATLGELLPKSDPRLAYPHFNLGVLLQRRDTLGEAESHLKAAVEIRRASLGERHPETALARSALAQTLLQRWDFAAAEEAARAALAPLEGVDAFGAANARAVLADVLIEVGRSAEALSLVERSIADLKPVLPAGHPLLMDYFASRGRALNGLGRYREAAEEIAPLIEGLEKRGPDGAHYLTMALDALADARRGLGRGDEALALRDRARKLTVSRYGADSAATAVVDCERALDRFASSSPEDAAARLRMARSELGEALARLRRTSPNHRFLPRFEAAYTELERR